MSSELIQPVKNGEIQTTKTTTTNETKKNDLDKNSFLKLLTTQMKYQDPLNPNTDTEYVAQLATFSQLEQLQNLGSTATNSQAFSLVGKNVTIKTENDAGDATYISGRVDFVSMNNGKAMLSINGSLYSIDQLDSVIDTTYLTEKNLPYVTQATALKYDAADPEDQTIEVNLGNGSTVADKVAIAINDKAIDQSLIMVKDGKVTIDASAFKNLENGTYNVTVVFNDSLYTTVNDKVTLQVQNAVITASDDDSTSQDTSGSTAAQQTGASTGTNEA